MKKPENRPVTIEWEWDRWESERTDERQVPEVAWTAGLEAILSE